MNAAITEFDPESMFDKVRALPEQIEEAVELSKAIPISRELHEREFHNVVLCGMGGSAISGDIVSSLLSRDLSIPFSIVRDYSLPDYVGKYTLLIPVSYSGNTEETICCLREGIERGAAVFAISSGGTIKNICDERGLFRVSVPPGWPPRTAVGHLVVPILGMLRSVGLSDTNVDEFESRIVPVLREVRKEYFAYGNPPNTLVKDLAEATLNRTLMIYGPPEMAPVARRWMCQINENGKALAHWGLVPEMNHNELVGWGDDSLTNRFTAVFLTHKAINPRIRRRMVLSMKIMEDRGIPTVEIEAPGGNQASSLMSALYLGDILSIYLAAARKKDPTPVRVIENLKRSLAK